MTHNEPNTHMLDELCTLLLQNDTRLTRLGAIRGVFGYGRRLGDALINNTIVTSIVLRVDDLLDLADIATFDNAIPLLQYLQTSAVVKEVTVHSNYEHVQSGPLIWAVIQAVAINSNITSIDVSQITLLPPDLLTSLLLTTNSSITKLAFCDHFIERYAALWDVTARALGEHGAVQDVTIRLRYGTNATGTPERLPNEPILTQLALNAPTSSLQSLCLDMYANVLHFGQDHFVGIANVLQSTRALQTLKFVAYTFNGAQLQPILNALRINATVCKLFLQACVLDEDATADWVDFMQRHCNKQNSRNNNGEDDENSSNSILSDVTIQSGRGWQAFVNSNVGTVASTMLIGSSVTSLHLMELVDSRWAPDAHHFGLDLPCFFRVYAQHAADIRLSSLHIDLLETTATTGRVQDATAMLHHTNDVPTTTGSVVISVVDALIDCLPQMVHLRHFDIAGMSLPTMTTLSLQRKSLLQALRRNGSLYSVLSIQVDHSYTDHMDSVVSFDVTDSSPSASFFTPTELRRVQAYCMRNKVTPLLLQPNQPDPELRREEQRDSEPHDDNFKEGKLSLLPSMMPDLMCASLPAVPTLPNCVRQGLLRLWDDELE